MKTSRIDMNRWRSVVDAKFVKSRLDPQPVHTQNKQVYLGGGFIKDCWIAQRCGTKAGNSFCWDDCIDDKNPLLGRDSRFAGGW